jgi:hypothetical protein
MITPMLVYLNGRLVGGPRGYRRRRARVALAMWKRTARGHRGTPGHCLWCGRPLRGDDLVTVLRHRSSDGRTIEPGAYHGACYRKLTEGAP